MSDMMPLPDGPGLGRERSLDAACSVDRMYGVSDTGAREGRNSASCDGHRAPGHQRVIVNLENQEDGYDAEELGSENDHVILNEGESGLEPVLLGCQLRAPFMGEPLEPGRKPMIQLTESEVMDSVTERNDSTIASALSSGCRERDPGGHGSYLGQALSRVEVPGDEGKGAHPLLMNDCMLCDRVSVECVTEQGVEAEPIDLPQHAPLTKTDEGEILVESELRAKPDDADRSVLRALPYDASPSEFVHAQDRVCAAPGGPRLVGERPEWSNRRQRRLGEVDAHARFLQHLFRRSNLVRPGCWRAGGLARMCVFRPVRIHACGQGLNLAQEMDFQAQADRAGAVLDWYRNYVELLRLLRGGATPTVVDGCCGGGGKCEGVRRAGGASHGVDSRPQEDFARRFGSNHFTLGDATSPLLLKSIVKAVRAVGVSASPPCKARSTARVRGEPKDPDLMQPVRDALLSTGLLYAIECVLGAGSGMSSDSTTLSGAMFGLRVDRPRLFETNFPIHLDEALVRGGSELRARCCQGCRRRWRRRDPFGRPEELYCCRGNTFAVQGDKPWRCTLGECAAAMGVDAGHMSYHSLSQAIPPVYGQLVFTQMCMQECARSYGIEAMTYDDLMARPTECRRKMRSWLQGAGESSGQGAVHFAHGPARTSGLAVAVEAGVKSPTDEERQQGMAASEPQYEVEKGAGGDEVEPASEERVWEAEFREVFFSHAGGYAQQIEGGRWPELMDAVGVNSRVPLDAASLAGSHTLVHVGRDRLRSALPILREMAGLGAGTRVTVISDDRLSCVALEAAGYKRLRQASKGEPRYASDSEPAFTRRGYVALECGRVRSAGGARVDYSELEKHMDPRDLTKDASEPFGKAARSYLPMHVELTGWDDLELSQELSRMMKEGGHVIRPEVEPGFAEFPFYPFKSEIGLMKSIVEANRALLVGAMEYVPPEAVEMVRSSSIVHPWSIVDQGGGKWRLCHDYSVGTNRYVSTSPFDLCDVWDVRQVLKPSSFMAKYDVRDGFWNCAVAQASRKRLVVRHPGTGRLMWASRLPFGFLDSPRLFCGVTEALAQRLRRRAAGLGIHFFVFVDDFLVVGDDEEKTRLGMDMLEEELAARGVQWAPHKERGPCQCIEFLGLLISNVAGMRGITISRKRLERTNDDLREWLAREPMRMGTCEADPVEVAKLLGRLVFISQVVKGGRTYMQGMLATFQGLTVDWQRGVVKVVSSQAKGRLVLAAGFWRDLHWWQDHLEVRSLASLESDQIGEAAITGTDASGWGTGQVAWIDGGREEVVLKFTATEKRKPINWRELLGVLRVVEHFGHRLHGRTVLVETDNMAAKGAATKIASKAEDMQELLRRLLEACERWGITLRVTHTPGEKLFRPDQTSRGDPIEEPRMRLRRAGFNQIEREVGGFTEFVGAERAHVSVTPEVGVSRLWVHPTFRTVGSALKLLCDRLGSDESRRAQGYALVPEWTGQGWGKLLKHGRVLRSWGKGELALEMCIMGRWVPTRSARSMALLAFPRAAGAYTLPLVVSISDSLGWLASPEVYTTHPVDSGLGRYRVVGAGSYVLQVADVPRLEAEMVEDRDGSESGGHRAMSRAVAKWIKVGQLRVWRLVETFDPGAEDEEAWPVVSARQLMLREHSGGHRSGGPSSDAGGDITCVMEWSQRAKIVQIMADQLWTIDHLVKEDERLDSGHARGRSTFLARISVGIGVSELRRARRALVAVHGEEPSSAVSHSEPVWPTPAAGEENPLDEEEDQLADVLGELARLQVHSSSMKKGPEGVRVVIGRPATMSGEPPRARMVDGEVVQPSPYDGIMCRGCDEPIHASTDALSCGDGLVHLAHTCRKAARARVEAGASMASNKEFYVVSVGRKPGIYISWADCKAQTNGFAGARYRGVDTLDEARQVLAGRASMQMNRSRPSASYSTMPADVAAAVPGGDAPGSIQRRGLLEEKIGPARLQMLSTCIDGRCGHMTGSMTLAGPCEAPTMCRGGCGRSLHMLTCGQVGKGYAALGRFTCHHCYAALSVESGEITKELLDLSMITMFLEMTQGAEATAGSWADFARLEQEYSCGSGLNINGGKLLMPHSGLVPFKNFLSWFVVSSERSLSLRSMLIGAESMLTKLGLPNFPKMPEVKAHVKMLERNHGLESTPSTTATPMMMQEMQETTIPNRFKVRVLVYRWIVMFLMEGLGGLRIGEATSGGDFHGVLANNSCIVMDQTAEAEWAKEVVEVRLEHSKTGHARYVDIAGETVRSKLQLAKYLRLYWEEAGIETDMVEEGNLKIVRPDAWVVKITMLGMTSDDVEQLIAWLGKAERSGGVRAYAKASQRAARDRFKPQGPGSQAKKHVNIAGGRGASTVLGGAYAEARAFIRRLMADRITKEEADEMVAVVPRPLVISTQHPMMGLDPGSTSGTMKELLTAACEAVGANDPHLSAQLRAEAKWTSHSLRRAADTEARRSKDVTDQGRKPVTASEIDLFFGWHEEELSKDMQIHYSTLSLAERLSQARITCMT